MIEDNILKISASSDPAKVGGALASLIKEQKTKPYVELRAIGAGAVNQAVKSIIKARIYLAPIGINLYCIPAFDNCEIEDGVNRSLIKLIVKAEV